jgi:Gas vesicle synthesis protein GvpL/GvpF
VSGSPRAMADTLVYLYAVGGAALREALPPGLTGIGGGPVRILVEGRLGAAVNTVEPLEFSEEALQRNLEDLTWLAATARAHHAVVDRVWQHQPVAPLRLATVYLDDDNVRALLRAKEAAFTAALDRLRGRREWGVKAFARSQPDADPDRSGADATVGPGAAYLLRKRKARDRVARAQQDVQDAAADLHRILSAAAAASHLYPPQDPQLSGHREHMVLNAAYLVEESGAGAFVDAVRTWHSPHIHQEMTGPWAPYSFATLGES